MVPQEKKTELLEAIRNYGLAENKWATALWKTPKEVPPLKPVVEAYEKVISIINSL